MSTPKPPKPPPVTIRECLAALGNACDEYKVVALERFRELGGSLERWRTSRQAMAHALTASEDALELCPKRRGEAKARLLAPIRAVRRRLEVEVAR